MASFYITDRQAAMHGTSRPTRTRRMVIEIPESLFHAVNRARDRFSEEHIFDKRGCPLHVAITHILQAAAKDGEI